MKKRAWIRLLGIVGLVFVLFGAISIFNTADDPLFRNISLSQIAFGLILCAIYVITSFGETVAALLRNKEKLLGLLAGVFIFILIVGVNAISQSYWGEIKWDVTKNKIHSLDTMTAEILKKLDTEIEIISFVADPRIRPLFENLAARYQYLNPKITYRTLDAKKDPKLAKQYEVQENQIIFENKKSKKTVKLDRGQINEQEFTSAIRRVLGEAGKKIYYASLSDQSPLEDQSESGLMFMKMLLEREGYQVESINLLKEARIPEDASLFLLWSHGKPYPSSLVQNLITYVEAGGKIMIGQDPMLSPAKDSLISHNLDPLLQKFGLEVPNSIIVQLRPALALRQKGNQQEIVRTGTQRLIRIAGLADTGHPIVEPLKNEIFDFVFALPVNQSKTTNDQLTREVITQTAESAILEPSIKKLLQTEEVSKEVLTGTGPIPIAQSASLKLAKAGPYGDTAKIVVFGNAEFARNSSLQQSVANSDLMLNAFNFLVDSKEGFFIRPKSWTPSTLKISEETRTGVYFASIFLLPMLIIIFGLSVWNFRRSRV